MTNPIAAKLGLFRPLSDDDRRALDALCALNVRRFVPGQDIVVEGERPAHVHVFLSGWACRYRQFADGRRQIIAFLLPGDFCDQNVFLLNEIDHSIAALTPVTVAEASRGDIDRLTLERPILTQALWCEALVTLSVQREWTVNLGQRNAAERVAHLLCELFYRLRFIGLTDGNGCDLPLTQADLASATGLSAVHTNRALQALRAAGLILLQSRRLSIPHVPALQDFARFSPTYLHLDRRTSLSG